jgi:hypothetical protein
MIASVLTLLLLQASAPSPDSVSALRKAARRAEAEFERLARQLAPVKFSSMDGTQCDEIVGRFCLRYDVGEMPAPPEEPSRVTLARRLAIEALRHAFSYKAEELATSGPLVRYLVEDGRAQEGASAARTFAALSGDSIWGPLLLGFALHATQDDTAAERLFAEGLSRMPAKERRRIEDVEWLISYDDRRRYKKLEPARRADFHTALWAFSDPLYLTPGNERSNEHIARHIWSRVLELAPLVGEMTRWGHDLLELTVRYGTPSARTRSPGTVGRSSGLVEHFDPHQLAYVPEDLLTRGPPPTPLPGETWTLENPRTRSGHAPRTVRKLVPLTHQITRFPQGDSAILRVDAAMTLDGEAARDSVLTGFWVLAPGGRRIRELRGTGTPSRDTVRFSFETALSAGEYVYSAEGLEPQSRYGSRARYATDIPFATGGLRLSDPLIAEPFRTGALPARRSDPVLRPRASLAFQAGDTIGLYAESRGFSATSIGRAAYRVELSLRRADRSSLPSRLVSWLGQRLRLAGAEPAPRLSYEAEGDPSGTAVIAVDLPLDARSAGLYVLTLEITDLVNGERSRSSRVLRIDKAS